MSAPIHRRLEALEAARAHKVRVRLCLSLPGESDESALLRHGIDLSQPGTSVVILPLKRGRNPEVEE